MDASTSAPPDAAPLACPGCGEPRVDGAAFCHRCGHAFGASPAASTPAPEPMSTEPAGPATATLRFGLSPGATPPLEPLATAAGTGQSAPQDDGAGYAQPYAQPVPAPPADPSAKPYASPYVVLPPGARSSTSTVIVIVAVLFGAVFLLGILAAIAIPNFLRYQQRAKVAEIPTQLVALDRAERAHRASGKSYVVFPDGLPAAGTPGRAKLAWTADELEQVRAFGWEPGEATYARFAVDGQEDGNGNQAIAICAETDVDGDGRRAAWVLFRPAENADGAVVVPPPDAPCSGTAVLVEGSSMEFDPAFPPGRPRRLSPESVF